VNLVEQLQGEIAVMTNRIRKLEVQFASLAVTRGDEQAAAAVAEELGFPVEILIVPTDRAKRVALARELHRRRWSQARIARVLHACERTIERYTRVSLDPINNSRK
jgi:hypothetical protein